MMDARVGAEEFTFCWVPGHLGGADNKRGDPAAVLPYSDHLAGLLKTAVSPRTSCDRPLILRTAETRLCRLRTGRTRLTRSFLMRGLLPLDCGALAARVSQSGGLSVAHVFCPSAGTRKASSVKLCFKSPPIANNCARVIVFYCLKFNLA